MENAYRRAPPVGSSTVVVYRSKALGIRLFARALASFAIGYVVLASPAGGAFPMVLVPVVVGSAALVLLGTVWQRVTVRFDWACRAVVLEWHRWPFRSSSRSLPLEEVAGAEVEEKTSTDDGRVFHAVLTLTSGERVPLVDGSTHRAHHEHAAERIRAELARKEMSLHGAAGAPRAGPVGSVDRPPVSD